MGSSSSKTTTLSASSALLPSLPEDILVEILSKLPAKSLVRFKCVSKFFYSLFVDHPCFADLHRNWSLTLPSSRMRILIFFPIIHWYYTLDYSVENQQLGELQANRLRYIDEGPNFSPTSSVDGLICFVTGFDSVSRRYKVLKSQSTKFSNGDESIRHWVFTLGVDKSWREIHSPPFYHCYNNRIYFDTSVHIDGIIYSFNSGNGKIIAFDFKAENFPEIPPPPPTIMKPRFIEMHHRLAIVDLISDPFDPNLHMKIWRLEESMVWEEQYLNPIPIPLEERNCECFSKANLAFATNHIGEMAVLVSFCTFLSILFYNFRTESWRRFDICELPLYGCGQLRVNMNFILDNVF
ncbi:putative F-box protein At5g38810 [Ipomoea triloba]|uniref:putative F-box protein At5g38810 n=1 Tax=Ipomoea triloba TaxID=35885 RepID=UPI00125DB7A0|nr:putative F-box protein At5g38810 [Ipomoea triloba]